MNLGISLPKESGTFGVWLKNDDNGDVHVYAHNQTHEGSGVIIGCNPTYKNLLATDPALSLREDGASLQFIDAKGNVQNVPLSLETVHAAILETLMKLKAIFATVKE